MLARLQRRNRHFGMESIGRGDGHDIDFGIGDQVAPIAGRLGKSELGSLLMRDILVDLGEVYKTRCWPVAEYRVDANPGQGVAFAHVAGADQADAECWFHSVLRSL